MDVQTLNTTNMIHLVLTYNIDNATDRTDFVSQFEGILQGMGMNKEATNQSTYFGAYRTKEDFGRDLLNAVKKLEWKNGDEVTIYHPKVQVSTPRNLADIGRHAFKSSGNTILNHIIYKAG
jgi:hypothetical protein